MSCEHKNPDTACQCQAPQIETEGNRIQAYEKRIRELERIVRVLFLEGEHGDHAPENCDLVEYIHNHYPLW